MPQVYGQKDREKIFSNNLKKSCLQSINWVSLGINLKQQVMSKRVLRLLAVQVVCVIALVGLVSLQVYLDYKVYKAKYPNTTVWMYVVDSNN